MKYPVAFNKWRQEEYLALMNVLGSDRYTCGKKVSEFEKLFCETFGYKYAVMTNSGSSANLLIVAAMFYLGRLKRDSTIIVPAIAWSTSYAPFIQFGMKLRVVDIDIDTLGYDTDALCETKGADAILAVNMLGNPQNYERFNNIIEDNCEAMGIKSTNSVASSFSMFYSHHISTMEGGVVATSDRKLYEIILSLRSHGWDRATSDNLYNFVYPGYNVRPTEITAAVGLTQLERFDEVLDGYRRNALFFKSTVGKIPGIKTQRETGKSSWMGFYILVEKLTDREFADLLKILKVLSIETRPVMCCFHKQPMRKFANVDIPKSLVNAEKVFERGFYVGNSCNDIRKEIIMLDSRLRGFMEGMK